MTTFPRRHARTRRFSLGVPRSHRIAPDGTRVLFLRSAGAEDPLTSLWLLDLVTGEERELVDPADLDVDDADLPPEERALRERRRELAGGVTAFATDDAVTLAAFVVGGRLHTVDVATATVVVHPTAGPAFDPRPSPDGRRVAYVSDDDLHLLDLVSGPASPGVTRPLVVDAGIAWGRAEFIAAEEMGRDRGHWWGPDATRVAVTRVDESGVASWHLGDPATPDVDPPRLRYPAAGTADADVRLCVLSVEGGRRVDVVWDREAFPYLARVSWGSGPLTIQVQSRDQRTLRTLTVDPDDGRATLVREVVDDAWVELVPGAPAWSGGRLVTVEDVHDLGDGGSRALVIDGEPVTPAGVQVTAVLHAGDEVVSFVGVGDDPTTRHVFRWNVETGCFAVTGERVGVHAAVVSDTVQVTTSITVDTVHPEVDVRWVADDGQLRRHELAVHTLDPGVTPRPELLELGPRRLRAALLRPTDDDGGPLPVLLDPYGGPHAQRVLRSGAAFLTSQWFADQGFAVLVVDGRGSPARGPAWERAVHGDLAGPPLEDQLDALAAAAEHEPRLDLTRVAMRGWSFGGFLSALAVLRRPDAVHAAIAGAPVTDWHLYDTHYTERYLGHPSTSPDAYARSGLVDDDGRLLGAAPRDGAPEPDLLLIHGLADDNVVAAHAVRLSAAMLAEGRRHRFVPLSGVTHVAGGEEVAERLLELQVAYLREVLAVG